MNEAIINKPKKKNIRLVALIVVALTIFTMGISYSSFFSIESQSTIQHIKAGVLDVVIDNHTVTIDELIPMEDTVVPLAEDSAEDQSEVHSTITLLNEGNLDAEYSITFIPDTLEQNQVSVDYQYVIISIFDVYANEWHNFGTEADPVYSTPLSTLENNGAYPVLRNIIDQNVSHQYRVYFWLSGDMPISEIGNYVYLKFIVKSMTINGRIED